jgi:hypothetical protein
MKNSFLFILCLLPAFVFGETDRWRTGELLVRCERAPSDLGEFADRHGVAAAVPLGGGWMQLRLVGEELVQAEERLAAAFASVQRNFLYSPRDTPDDTRLADQYAVDLLRLTDAWDMTLGPGNGAPGGIIAVIDNGVDHSHLDLSASVWDGTHCVTETGDSLGNCVHGYDFANDDLDPAPVDGHGTHVAGVIAATSNNSQGISGVSRSSQIMALRTDLSTAQVVRAINFAGANGAQIINLSWGFGAATCAAVLDQALYEAIADFDGLVVIAAGDNDEEHDLDTWFDIADFAHDTDCWSGLVNVISVTASDANDARGTNADYGAGVHLAAPGVAVLSTEPGDAYGNRSGSSIAAAHVSGTAALLWAFLPDFGATDFRHFLLAGADTISTDQGDMLRLNSYAVLARLAQPSPLNLRIFADNSEQTAIGEGSSTSERSPFFRWDAPSGQGVIASYNVTGNFGSFDTADSFFDLASRGLSLEVGEHEVYVTARNDAGGSGDSLVTYFTVTAPTVNFFQSSVDQSEGDSVTIQVDLSEPAAESASVTVRLAVDEGPPSDHMLSWDAGTSGIRSFTVDLDNETIDGVRSVSGTLVDPVSVLIGEELEIGFSLFDNDPRIGVTVHEARAAEHESLVFIYQLSKPAEVPVSFDYQLTADSAIPDVDYADAAVTITLGVGGSTGIIVVPLIDDDDVEGPETFGIALSNLVGVQPDLSQLDAFGTIVDNDIVLDLQPGWNLVGSSLVPSLGRTALSGLIDISWYWDADQQRYRRGDNLTRAGAGHWVHASEAGQIIATGTEAPAPIQRPGWNLVTPLIPGIAAPYSFGWDGSNFTRPGQFEIGKGYWLLLPSDQ